MVYTNISCSYINLGYIRLLWQEYDGKTLSNHYQTYRLPDEEDAFHIKWAQITNERHYVDTIYTTKDQ